MPIYPGPVVLFGAEGFVGRHLRRRLQDASIDVVVPITRTGSRVDISGPVQPIREAIADARVVVNAAGRAHIHAPDPSAFWPANTLGAWHVAEAVASSLTVRRLVHVSSVAVAAGGMAPAVADYQPNTAYGASKAAGEIAVAGAMRGADADLVVVRPAGIGGVDSPGSWGKIRRLVEAGKIVPVPDNVVRHDVVEIDEVVDLLTGAVTGIVPAGVYTLAGSGPVTLAEYAQAAAQQAGKPARIVRVPDLLLRSVGATGEAAKRITRPANRVEQLVSTLTRQRPLVIQSTNAHRA